MTHVLKATGSCEEIGTRKYSMDNHNQHPKRKRDSTMKRSLPTIAFILKGYPRLSETFITNEILMLEELGFRIHIFAMRNPGESKIHDSVFRVKAPVTYIPDHFWRHIVKLLGANLRLFFQQPKRFWKPFSYALMRSLRQRSSSTLKRFVQAAYFVQKHLPETAIVHLHAHFSHGPTTVAYFASWLTGLRYSFSAHAKDIYVQEPEFFRRKLERAAFVVTCTGYNARHMRQIAPKQKEIHCIYHGVDTHRFRPGEATDALSAAPVNILSVGRFVPKKGFPTLIRALARVNEKGYAFHCDIIGGGPLADELKTLVRELELHEKIRIHSKKSQEELLPYYQSASLFALACEVQSDGDRDGIPNVLVEAMAMGIPCVSTSISGIPELIDHGVNGLLVPEKDIDALAEALIYLLDHPDKARELSKAARRKVEQEFCARSNIHRIGELLEAVAPEARQRMTTGMREAAAGARAEHVIHEP